MRYIQTELTDEEFIVIKKVILDASLALKDFIKAAIFEKILRDAAKNREVEGTEEISSLD